MAENAYSCKTNFIILPLHRPPRSAFRLAPLYLFHCSSAFHAHNESPNASLFPVTFVERGQLQISLTNPENARRSVFKYSHSFAFLHAFPPPVFPLSVVYPRTNRDILPPSLSFSSTIHSTYIYFYTRQISLEFDSTKSNLFSLSLAKSRDIFLRDSSIQLKQI